MFRKLLFIFFIFIINGFSQIIAYATNPEELVNTVVLDSENSRHGFLNQYLSIFEDQTNLLTFNEIISEKYANKFLPLKSFDQPLKASNTYWGKISIKNNASEDKQWLFQTAQKGTNFSEVYYFDKKGKLVTKESGEYVPFEEKELPKNRKCKVILSIPAKTTYNVFIKIKNVDKRPPVFDVKISSIESYHQELEQRNLFQGIFQGIIWIMMVYNLFLYFYIKDKAYLFYAVYIGTMMLYFIYYYGFAIESIAKSFPQINPFIYALSGLATVSYFQFIRLFVDTKKLIPFWDKILLWVIRGRLIILAVELSILSIDFNYYLVSKISTYVLLSAVLFSSILLIALLKTRSSLALYLIFGTVSLKIMALLATFLLVFWEVSFAVSFIQLGIILEILLFSFGLGYRFKINDEKRINEQQKLINQLKKSEKLRIELNQELEKKVQERTEKVREHQQEIALQAKELVEMNWELYEKNDELYKTNDELEITNHKLSSSNKELNFLNEKLNNTLGQLKAAQVQLIQSEKMASVGLLTAGIAHEINNPINFVYAGVETLEMVLTELMEVLEHYDKIGPENSREEVIAFLKDMERMKEEFDFDGNKEDAMALIKDIKEGAVRTAEIVRGLRVFSRLDEDELKTANIHDGLDSTLTLLRTQLKGGVKVVKEYDTKLPIVECYPGQLNQVFMNVLVNAIHAVKEKQDNEEGKVIISTTVHSLAIAGEESSENEEGDFVEIRITDNGNGIPDEVKEKIFEPFYTTKDVGEGTGLGLSISHSIIEKHFGKIVAESKEGEGTSFSIVIPVKQSQ
ncbi:sensor histidine kinase [Flexithrix dorotheae]|uniref:sensor histidine kinase n=1 Tax=Flexithrix dorotheae TaxID=70993 RepID=UPI00036DD5F8|nr:7TM diverse intracellular signaling domain-containing protein [Flexithrix dorotheae]